jgi:hypothetical protein
LRLYCSVEGCNETYDKVDSLRKHIKRKHRDVFQDGPDPDNRIDEENAQENIDPEPLLVPGDMDELNLKLSDAKFLLRMKHTHRLTQVAVNGLVAKSKELIADHIAKIKSCLIEKLRENNIDFDELDFGGIDIFSTNSLFECLGTTSLQQNFFKEECNLVEPKPVVFGRTLKWQKDGVVKEVENVGYIVDLIEQLQALLNDPAVLYEVENPHFSQNDEMCDIMDGHFFKTHPVFSVHVNGLQILGYYDDLELVNLVGSAAKKHKVGMFYWTLGNIRPCLRSTLKSIHLIAVAKTAHIRANGLPILLENFITSLNKLSEGHVFLIKGVETVMYGGLLSFSGDTPGSNFISGFKEGVGFAHCKCRRCMCTVNNMSLHYFAEQFVVRNLALHREQCDRLLDDNIDERERQNRSKIYGVNYLSVLDEVRHFDICRCFPQDIMHIIFEGVLNTQIKLLLGHVLLETGVTIDDINRFLDSFDFQTSAGDRPAHLERSRVVAAESKLNQSSAQLRNLAYALPFFLAPYLDDEDEHYLLYIKLLQVTSICMSHRFTLEDISYLRFLIGEYLESFVSLFPFKFVPKHHYLVHLPEQIMEFGPLRNYWCMRYEGKHSYFKQLMGRSKCFKNVPRTLASNHQQALCLQLLGSSQTRSNYLYAGDQYKGVSTLAYQDECYLKVIDYLGDGVDDNEVAPVLSKAEQVTIVGYVYSQNASVLRLNVDTAELPRFGKVVDIVIHDRRVLFIIAELITSTYDSLFHAYLVAESEVNATFVCDISELVYPQPLWSHIFRKQQFVSLRDSSCAGFLV